VHDIVNSCADLYLAWLSHSQGEFHKET